MFERYTQPSRRVIFFARYEAAEVGSPTIETEHLLLGLLREDHQVCRFVDTGDPAEIVGSIRTQIEALTSVRQKVSVSLDLPLSHESKRVLAYAYEESQRMDHKHVGTEHLLLGLLREEHCLAARLLGERGVQLEKVRHDIGSLPPKEPRHWWMRFARLGEEAARSPRAPLPYNPLANLARHEAYRAGSPCIETRHLLLAALIASNHPALESVRLRLQPDPPRRERVALADLPLTESSQRALAYCLNESRIADPAHLLLGLLQDESSEAARVLREHGVTIENIRTAMANPPPPPPGSQEGRDYV